MIGESAMNFSPRCLAWEVDRTNNDSSALAKGWAVLRVSTKSTKRRSPDLISSLRVCYFVCTQTTQTPTHYKAGVMVQSEFDLVRKMFPETSIPS